MSDSPQPQGLQPPRLLHPWDFPGNENLDLVTSFVNVLLGSLKYSSVSVSVQSLSRVRLSATPWTAARQASLSVTNSWSLLKLMSIQLVMPFNHLILYHPLLFLPSIFPSIRVFSNESVLHIRWLKYWSFSISPSNKHPGPISFRRLIGSPCSYIDSQESSPTPQFKSISSSALSSLYSPILTSIHDH